MVDILSEPVESVLDHMRTAVKDETVEVIATRIADLKEAAKTARVESNLRKYILGIEIPKNAYDKLLEEHPRVMEAHPAEERKYPKIVVKDDGTHETKVTIKFINLSPVGQDDVPMGKLSEDEALMEHTELTEADVEALHKAQEAVANATEVKELRATIATLEGMKSALLVKYRVPSYLYVTRSSANTAKIASAEKKLAKAIATEKFIQTKIACLGQIQAERHETKAIDATLKIASEWMNASGMELVKKELGA